MGNIKPHKALSKKCNLCHVMHSPSSHKSHGKGSFAKTHSPSFSDRDIQALSSMDKEDLQDLELLSAAMGIRTRKR